MRRLFVLILLMSIIYSCKDKKSYQLQIIIRNEINDNLLIKLFPKSNYMSNDLYDFSEIGGGFRKTDIEIKPNTEKEIYITDDLAIKPNVLALQVFDSIFIQTVDSNNIIIKFFADTVCGYDDNLFDENSNWTYKVRELDMSTSTKKTVESNDYIFKLTHI